MGPGQPQPQWQAPLWASSKALGLGKMARPAEVWCQAALASESWAVSPSPPSLSVAGAAVNMARASLYLSPPHPPSTLTKASEGRALRLSKDKQPPGTQPKLWATHLNWMLRTGASVKSDTHSMLTACCTWAPPSTVGSTGLVCRLRGVRVKEANATLERWARGEQALWPLGPRGKSRSRRVLGERGAHTPGLGRNLSYR